MSPTNQNEFVGIGSVPGLGLPQFHVGNLLKHFGVPAIIEGSVLYGIQVPRKDGNKALAILQKDASVRPFMYWSLNKIKVDEKVKIPTDIVFLNCNLNDFSSKDPLLEGLVNAPIEWERIKAEDIGTIYAASYKKFDYMNNAGNWEPAYFGKVIYTSQGSDENVEAYTWSWDKGKAYSIANYDVFKRYN